MFQDHELSMPFLSVPLTNVTFTRDIKTYKVRDWHFSVQTLYLTNNFHGLISLALPKKDIQLLAKSKTRRVSLLTLIFFFFFNIVIFIRREVEVVKDRWQTDGKPILVPVSQHWLQIKLWGCITLILFPGGVT